MNCTDCGLLFFSADGKDHPLIKVNDTWFRFCSKFCLENWVEENLGLVKEEFEYFLFEQEKKSELN